MEGFSVATNIFQCKSAAATLVGSFHADPFFHSIDSVSHIFNSILEHRWNQL